MTASDRLWTDTDRELAGDALAKWCEGMGLPPYVVRPYGAVVPMLDALTAAGWRKRADEWERVGAELDTEMERWPDESPDFHRGLRRGASIARHMGARIDRQEVADA